MIHRHLIKTGWWVEYDDRDGEVQIFHSCGNYSCSTDSVCVFKNEVDEWFTPTEKKVSPPTITKQPKAEIRALLDKFILACETHHEHYAVMSLYEKLRELSAV